MGNPVSDLLGQRFGRLTVIRRAPNRPGRGYSVWRVRCSCGTEKTVIGHNLTIGTTTSCGCRQREGRSPVHGRYGTTEYRAWRGAMSRCFNRNNPSYSRYGGRGIRVCARWRNDFRAFFADMGLRPSPKHSLDRKRNSGDYTPRNCRWATQVEQARNRSRRRMITAFGRRLGVVEWAELTGVPDTAIRQRLVLGWDTRLAVAVPTGGTYIDGWRDALRTVGIASTVDAVARWLEKKFPPPAES